MYKPVTTLLAFFMATVSFAQNMVYNPGFESYSLCPTLLGDIARCDGWNKPTSGSSDYFNSCANGGQVDVPDNYSGHQQAAGGDAYVGIHTWTPIPSNYREYFMGYMQTMQLGQAYKVSIKVSLAGKWSLMTDGLGVLFTVDTFTMSSGFWNALPKTPQADFSAYGAVSDTTNWVTLTDTIYADSAYTRLTIGCFKDDSTVVLDSAHGQLVGAYYYIDDVSVEPLPMDVQGYVVSGQSLSIYPNPFSHTCEIKFSNPAKEPYTFRLYDLKGREVKKINNIRSGSFTISKDDLPAGMYFYRLAGDVERYMGKFLID
ncbi:MAG TPA: T9SS type A sorting domain-containing protein [Flavipsychrobacter sp.]|nr:T9SS type A sorting domain-containing protein [Flavipsychrobacter sp.]